MPQGYFAPSCLEKLLTAVRAITSRGIWVVVAAKARYAAGEDTEPGAPPTRRGEHLLNLVRPLHR